MTTITRLTDATANERPVFARVYVVKDEADESRVLALYTSRYNRVPERVFVWRGVMYIETKEEEK
jgi:hypothetical protein